MSTPRRNPKDETPDDLPETEVLEPREPDEYEEMLQRNIEKPNSTTPEELLKKYKEAKAAREAERRDQEETKAQRSRKMTRRKALGAIGGLFGVGALGVGTAHRAKESAQEAAMDTVNQREQEIRKEVIEWYEEGKNLSAELLDEIDKLIELLKDAKRWERVITTFSKGLFKDLYRAALSGDFNLEDLKKNLVRAIDSDPEFGRAYKRIDKILDKIQRHAKSGEKKLGNTLDLQKQKDILIEKFEENFKQRFLFGESDDK